MTSTTTAMEYRQLGRSGLLVSVLGLGTMTFGGSGFYDRFGALDASAADAVLGQCLDAGVNFVDTANVYAGGESEEILGVVLKGRRDRMVVATKGYHRIGDGPDDVGASREYLVRAVEDSLRRLGTDHIDLYQLHLMDSVTPLEETVRALDELVRAGKIRYAGVCNFGGARLMKALSVADRLGVGRFVSHQVRYSLIQREVEAELVPLGVEEDLGTLAWAPLAGGLLTGKFNRRDRVPAGTRHTDGPDLSPSRIELLHAVVDELTAIAAERDVTATQVALNWLLGRPGVTTAIVGARTPAQITDSLAAASWRLGPDEIARLDAVSQRPWAYPFDLHEAFGGERNPYYLRGKASEAFG